jgi:hypothetical protein
LSLRHEIRAKSGVPIGEDIAAPGAVFTRR